MKTKSKTKYKIGILLVLLNSFLSYTQNLPNQITISVPRGDDAGFVTMHLQKYNVRDPQHCKLYHDQQSYTTSGDPNGANPSNFTEISLNNQNYPVRTYRGYVAEEPNSTVIAVIWPGNNTMTAFVQEGIRYLWQIEDLPITLNLSTGQANVSVSNNAAYNYSRINQKSQDWVPTFGNTPPPSPVNGSGPIPNGNSEFGWSLIPSAGFKKMRIAYDVEPEWFNSSQKANGNKQKMFAILEFATNALDLQFARDLGIQFRLSGVVLRNDTDLHTSPNTVKTTWKNNGLGKNPGSNNVKTNSIPVEHIVFTQIGEGNPVAYQSKTPLNGGNYTKVPVGTDENSGLQHEVSHTWGGAHFVYPNDIMSGGGSWFGPTTNQRHIFIREKASVTGNLPIASNQEYGWNVHPYTTPDLATTEINHPVTISVLKNDFDSNGDPIKIATFDSQSEKGGTVSMQNGTLIYQPPHNFKGRDHFNYTITDGNLYNTTWVQIDVNNGGLLLHYNFESSGNTLLDQSGNLFHGTSENFSGSLVNGKAGMGWNFPQLPGANTETDNSRAFVSFGDVVDPLKKGHTVSLWFKADAFTMNSNQNCHLVSNSSTAINKLINGYNIYIDGNSNKLTFEVMELLSASSPNEEGVKHTLTANTIQANTWYHLAMVIDREDHTLKAYVNGQLKDTQNLDPEGLIKGKPNGDRYTSGALGICTYKPKKYTPFVGVMDEFQIYGRALTATEIETLFSNPGDTIPDPDTTDPTDCLENEIVLNFAFDNYPEDIQWILSDDSGNTVASGGNYTGQTQATITNCLPNGCYTLTVNDSFGDGLCCQYGNGSYTLTHQGEVIASGSTFTSTQSTSFCLNNTAQTLIAGYYFENGWEGWTDGGEDCVLYTGTTNAYEGNNALRIRENNGIASSSTSPVLNLTAYKNVTIAFHFYADNMNNGDAFMLRYQDGTGWQTVKTWISGTHFTNNSFGTAIISLSENQYNLVANGKFRFQCQASSTTINKIFLDAIVISGTESTPAIPVSFSPSDTTTDLFSKLYPNPTTSEVRIELTEEAHLLTLASYNGLIIKTFNPQSKRLTIDLSDLPSGIYYINSYFKENKKTTRKVVKL